MKTIAIIGAGASGTLVAAQLLERARQPVAVVLVSRDGTHGRGVAYGTNDPAHLLNVRAVQMSAMPARPRDFVDCARAEDPRVDDAEFLPRATYARYLAHVLRRARDGAVAQLVEHAGDAVAVRTDCGAAVVELSSGERVRAEHVVLALGNLPPRTPDGQPWNGPRLVADPWSPRALEDVPVDRPVVLVGSGLTMADVALTLARRGVPSLHVVSRHGLLPNAHDPAPRPPLALPAPDDARRVSSIARTLRAAVHRGADWRAVIDTFRPRIVETWSALPDAEQRRFMRHVRPYWDVLRHRLPPRIAAALARLADDGRLVRHRGRVVRVEPRPDGVVVHARSAADGAFALHAGAVVNCTGPAPDLAAREPLRSLCAAGLAVPHPTGGGVLVDEDGALLDREGRPSRNLFTLGPTCRGARWESTAIPEIRVQAERLATRLLGAVE